MLKKLALAAFLFSSTTLSAFGAQHYSDCDFCDPCNGWHGSVDWIYWKTRAADLDYAVPFSTGNSIGHVSRFKPDYESGFRLGLEKQCDCFSLGMHYTYFHPDDTVEVRDANGALAGTRIVSLFNVLSQGNNVNLARLNWQLDYDVVDFVAAMDFWDCSCFKAQLFGGLKFAFIDQKAKFFYAENAGGPTDNAEFIRQCIDMNAYGVSFGGNACYELCSCLSLFGNFGYDVYVGDFDRRFRYITRVDSEGIIVTTRANIKDSSCYLVGTLNLAFGLSYQLPCLCEIHPYLAVGYEFHQWMNMPGYLDYQNVGGSEITFDRHLNNLSCDGLFVRLGAEF